MKFHIVNVAPKDFRFEHFLDDTCRLFCYGLESLGHDCSIGLNNIETSAVNVLVGAHLLSSAGDVQAITQSGAQYIVAQSEMLSADGVNLSSNPNQLREVYLPLLRGASSIWEGTPENLTFLHQMGIEACVLQGGYHPAMEEIVPKNRPDIDFLFYGSITPHRRDMLHKLQSRGYKLAVLFDARSIYRNDFIARAKVHLSPRQGTAMNHLPYGRICYLINNRRLVAVEQCHNQKWLEHCFLWADTDHWVDLCEEMLRRPDRQQLAEQFHERFRTDFPITDALARVLDEAGIGRPGPAAPHWQHVASPATN